MDKRHIGKSGLRVGTIGLGCNNFGWKIGQAESDAVVAKALDLGIDFFDTADRYGTVGGESETVLGKALGARRKDIVLLTKFGVDIDDYRVRQGSRRYLMTAVEGSLKRLGTDWIDVYMLHWPDYGTPIEETLRTLDDLVRSGKVRYIAVSNLEPWRIADAMWISKSLGLERFICCQHEHNLLNRDAEKELIPLMQHYGMGFVPYYPLASGLLTGKYANGGSGRLNENWLRTGDVFLNERNQRVVAALQSFCEARGHTLLELAINWLATQPTVDSLICGATKPEQVEQNVKALGWTLTAEERAEIDHLTRAG